MSTFDEKTVQMIVLLVVCGCLGLAVLCLTMLLMRRRDKQEKSTMTGTGTFCGHCGRRLGSDPVTAIGLGSKGYFVYKCPHCQNETLLPTQSVE